MAEVVESTVRAYIRLEPSADGFPDYFCLLSSRIFRGILDFIRLKTLTGDPWILLLHTPIIKKVYTLCIHFFSLRDDFDRFRVRMVLRTE